MPNIKIFVDEAVLAERSEPLRAAVGAVRSLLVDRFGAPAATCHLMLIPAWTAPGQSPLYVDMNFRPAPHRTPEAIATVCAEIEALLSAAADAPVRVRAAAQDIDRTYSVA